MGVNRRRVERLTLELQDCGIDGALQATSDAPKRRRLAMRGGISYPGREIDPMHPQRRVTLLLNVFGGAAVLGSYAYGLTMHPGNASDLWGGVPIEIRPLYTLSMLMATVGYVVFSFFIIFRLDPNRVRVAGRLGYGTFNAIYAGILVPSAFWMPLTFAVIAQPNEGLWFAIRAVLTLVGLSSLALIAALLTVEPRESKVVRRLAILGATAFAFQTALLDALVWPTFFSP